MFCWIGCADGTSINCASIDAFGVHTIPLSEDKPDAEGKPIPQKDAEGNPMFQMFVVAIIDGNTFPVRPVSGMNEAQLVIRSVLGNMKKEFKKAQQPVGNVEIADEDDVNEIAKAKKVLLGG